MLHGNKIEGSLRRQLWAEAALTAAELDQILVKYGVSEKPPLFASTGAITRHLRAI